MEAEKIKKVMFNEVSFLFSVIGVAIGIVLWISNPQKDMQIEIVKLQSQVENNQTVTEALEKIKNNDLHELQLRMERLETRQIEQIQAISRIEALVTNQGKSK